MNATPHVFTIRTLSNLHVGSGDISYGVVDKLVQRDPTTQLPTIHASSLKGALREHFVSSGKFSDIELEEIFGSDSRSESSVSGQVRFLNADLIAIPRPNHSSPAGFELIYSLGNTDQFIEKLNLLGLDIEIPELKNALQVDFENFNEYAGEEALPVIARNYLENGISKNLWYEEVVPRSSLFACILLVPGDLKAGNRLVETLDGNVVQLGANASIGYGLCLFNKIS